MERYATDVNWEAMLLKSIFAYSLWTAIKAALGISQPVTESVTNDAGSGDEASAEAKEVDHARPDQD